MSELNVKTKKATAIITAISLGVNGLLELIKMIVSTINV